jgi:hypothetical protein
MSSSARWYTVGQSLVTATYNGLTSKPGRQGQVPGEIAWDSCTCEGMLAVSVPRIFYSEEFPTEEEAPVGARCQAPYEVAEFTVSVVRCAPQPEGQEQAPPADALDAAAGLLLQDMTETMDALSVALCTLKDQDSIDDFMLSPAEAQGPEGACVGFNLRVRISLVRY